LVWKGSGKAIITTVGQILINDALPEDLRDYGRVLDKKNIASMLDKLAKRYPDEYVDVVQRLHELGGLSAYLSGHTVSLDDLESQPMSPKELSAIKQRIEQFSRSKEPISNRRAELAEYLSGHARAAQQRTLENLRKKGNPLADQVDSGSRGNPTQLNMMVGAPVMVMDSEGNPVPLPIANSFAHGMDPAEYFAHTFGTRTGMVGVKLGTAKAGALGKQLALAASRLYVSEGEPVAGVGLPVDADDPDNEGAVLAADVGPHKAGTVITSAMIRNWPKGTKQILVRSPVSDIAPDGGVPVEAAGYRERMTFPDVGENIGIGAVQAIAERIAQSALGSKHIGGAGGAKKGGFSVINQLAQVPATFPSGAAHAMSDGIVDSIKDAPQGGKYIQVGANTHYVDVDQEPIVSVGQKVEAGDVLSNGLPNPAVMVMHKGVGEGRRYFMNTMRDVLEASNAPTSRRNIELLSRALINHVEVTDESDSIPGALPGDTIEYDRMASTYLPRDDSLETSIGIAKGMYLEKPVLHYSIGTRVTPSIQKMLKSHGIENVTVNKERPPFVPKMNRAMTSMLFSPDWVTRLGGTYLEKGLLEAVHRGRSSDLAGKSHIPRVISGEITGGWGDDDDLQD